MFRSSVTARYAWLGYLFYNSGAPIRRGRFLLFLLPHRIRSEVEKVVYWMSQILLTAEIAFRGLDRGVSQQKLNLLKFTTTVVAQLRTGSAQIMRRNVF